MTFTVDRTCIICGTSADNAQLERCVMCLRYHCLDCGAKGSGRRFCSVHCAESFFHQGDEDDDTENDGD